MVTVTVTGLLWATGKDLWSILAFLGRLPTDCVAFGAHNQIMGHFPLDLPFCAPGWAKCAAIYIDNSGFSTQIQKSNPIIGIHPILVVAWNQSHLHFVQEKPNAFWNAGYRPT